ncbi:hypothetical protein BaRGS_00030340, partial [Batillaria attramentaria]
MGDWRRREAETGAWLSPARASSRHHFLCAHALSLVVAANFIVIVISTSLLPWFLFFCLFLSGTVVHG